MKSTLIVSLLAITFSFPVAALDIWMPSQTTGQTAQLTPAQQEAVNELKEAARFYRDGDFAEAQRHSENALALDPLNKTAPFFIARTIHAQYKPGDKNEANIAKAREAIDAYKRILALDPLNEEAYKAIAYLYGALKEDELLREWVLKRALDPMVSVDKRAEAFVVLASKDWDCSFKITELPTNHSTTILEHGEAKVRFTKPKDATEFEKARQCAANGLALVENAIALVPENESAWSYKTNLLMELSKLAEMDKNLLLKAEYDKQYQAAQHTTVELSSRRPNEATAKP